MMNKPDPRRKSNMMQNAAQQLGVSQNDLSIALNSGDPSALMRKLSPEDARKLQEVLSDKNAAARVLASPEAKALMQQLFGGNTSWKK